MRRGPANFQTCSRTSDRAERIAAGIQEPLGFLSPIEFDEQHYTDHATAEQAKMKPCQSTLNQLISTSRTTGEPQTYNFKTGYAQSSPERPHSPYACHALALIQP